MTPIVFHQETELTMLGTTDDAVMTITEDRQAATTRITLREKASSELVLRLTISKSTIPATTIAAGLYETWRKGRR